MNDLDQDLNGTPLVPRSYEPQVKDGEMEAKPKAVPGAEPGAVPEAVVDIEAFGEYHIEIRRPMDLEAIQAAAAAAAAAEEKGEGSKGAATTLGRGEIGSRRRTETGWPRRWSGLWLFVQSAGRRVTTLSVCLLR